MSELTIVFYGDDFTGIEEQLRAGFRALADESDRDEILETKVRGLEWQHENWEEGQSCPECGSDEFHCSQIENSIYEATEEGGMTCVDNSSYPSSSDFTAVMCNDPTCMAQLYRGPASYLSS